MGRRVGNRSRPHLADQSESGWCSRRRRRDVREVVTEVDGLQFHPGTVIRHRAARQAVLRQIPLGSVSVCSPPRVNTPSRQVRSGQEIGRMRPLHDRDLKKLRPPRDPTRAPPARSTQPDQADGPPPLLQSCSIVCASRATSAQSPSSTARRSRAILPREIDSPWSIRSRISPASSTSPRGVPTSRRNERHLLNRSRPLTSKYRLSNECATDEIPGLVAFFATSAVAGIARSGSQRLFL